jgi:hypothetical protein
MGADYESAIPSWAKRHVEADILRYSKRYLHKHHKHTHVAIICKGRKVLAIGHNHISTITPKLQMIHAEADAIRVLGDRTKLRGAILIVIRIASSGILNSKPCDTCQQLMEKCMRKYGLLRYIHS